jgi:hypothetical protein
MLAELEALPLLGLTAPRQEGLAEIHMLLVKAATEGLAAVVILIL